MRRLIWRRDRRGKRVSQSASIALADGTQYDLRFKYTFQPPAFCKPEYALFKGEDSIASIDFFFPSDSQVALIGSKLPDGIEIANPWFGALKTPTAKA